MSNHSSSTLLLNPLKASISRAVYKASAAASLSLGLSLLFAGQASAQEAIDLADEDNRIGYSIGVNIGQNLVAQGIIEEAERLLAMGLDPELTSSRAVGYRAVMDWLEGGKRVARSGLAERINLDTWALVRKQRKWFRRLGLAKDGE